MELYFDKFINFLFSPRRIKLRSILAIPLATLFSFIFELLLNFIFSTLNMVFAYNPLMIYFKPVLINFCSVCSFLVCISILVPNYKLTATIIWSIFYIINSGNGNKDIFFSPFGEYSFHVEIISNLFGVLFALYYAYYPPNVVKNLYLK